MWTGHGVTANIRTFGAAAAWALARILGVATPFSRQMAQQGPINTTGFMDMGNAFQFGLATDAELNAAIMGFLG